LCAICGAIRHRGGPVHINDGGSPCDDGRPIRLPSCLTLPRVAARRPFIYLVASPRHVSIIPSGSLSTPPHSNAAPCIAFVLSAILRSPGSAAAEPARSPRRFTDLAHGAQACTGLLHWPAALACCTGLLHRPAAPACCTGLLHRPAAPACCTGWRRLLLFTCVIAGRFPLEGSAARRITPTRKIRQRR